MSGVLLGTPGKLLHYFLNQATASPHHIVLLNNLWKNCLITCQQYNDLTQYLKMYRVYFDETMCYHFPSHYIPKYSEKDKRLY